VLTMRQLEHTLDRAQPPSPRLLCVRAVLSYVCHMFMIPRSKQSLDHGNDLYYLYYLLYDLYLLILIRLITAMILEVE
jgi:hypothetical protein